MTRLTIGPGTDVLIADRTLDAPAVVLGAAAGLNAFFWLKARYGVRAWYHVALLLLAALASGIAVVGGAIYIAGELDPAFGWVCAGLALIAVVFASYLWGTRSAGAASALLLLLFRLVAIAVLIVLYFEPTLKRVHRRVERSKLLVLIDESGSMQVSDWPEQESRLAWVRSELQGRDGVLAKLRESFDLELHAFSNAFRVINARELDTLTPKGRSTAFAPTVGEICSNCDKFNTTGALLFTDGIDNSGQKKEKTIKAIAAAGLPIFAVGVGGEPRAKGTFKDIAIKSVHYDRRMAADNKAEIVANIEGEGLEGRRVDVVFRFDGKEKDRQSLVLDGFQGTQAVTLSVTPRKKGTFKCSVEVTQDPAERIVNNNKKAFDVEVTDPAIKVLLIEGVIRAEYKWLVRTLQMDPNVQLLALIQVRKGVFNQQGNLKGIKLSGPPRDYDTLKKFDVILFGDVDRSLFTTTQLRHLQRFVEEGKGLLMTGGYSALGPGGYGGTPIEDVLPMHLGDKDIGQEKSPFTPQLTDSGRTHPIFAGITDFFERDEDDAPSRLPPLLGCTRVGAAKTAASVLAVHPRCTGPGGRPLVVAAVQKYGRGHAMVFSADTTWRWYLGLRGLGRNTPYIRFWGQAVRWLANRDVKEKDDKPGVVAYTDRKVYEPGSTVSLYAQVRDNQGQATDRATVTASIEGPSGPTTSRQITHIPGTQNKYKVEFDPPSPGEYAVRVKATTPEEGPLGKTKTLTFRVDDPNLELDDIDRDEDFLVKLGKRTRGAYVDMFKLDQLARRLKNREKEKTTITTVNVWNDDSVKPFGENGQGLSPYLIGAFLLFTALITVEWVLRRQRQLL